MQQGAERSVVPWLAAAVLFGLNALIVRDFFGIEYTLHHGSIEGAYIGLTRYLLEHFGQFGWFPFWYCGIPFENTYPPLFHFTSAGVAALGGLGPAVAHHATAAAFYCLGPVTFFALLYRFTSHWIASFSAGLLYTVASPSVWLMPGIAGDTGSWDRIRRLHSLVVYGDAPHLAGLALLPLALLGLDAAVRSFTPLRVTAAVLALAAVVLTNWLAAFALAIAALAYLLARVGDPDWMRMVGRSLAVALLAYGLASPWIPPGNIAAIQRNASVIGGAFPFTPAHLIAGLIVILGAAVLALLLARWQAPLPLRFGLLLFWFFAAICFLGEFFDFYLVPQSHRYHLELEWAALWLFGCGIAALPRLPRLAQWTPAAALLAFSAWQLHGNLAYARTLIIPWDIKQGVEYQIATYIAHNLPGERVFAIGSTQFWMNAFYDIPQYGGGFAQGITDPFEHVALFGIPYMQADGEVSAMWLRLMGIGAVAVSSPQGRDAYGFGWKDPRKYDAILPELWRQGGDAIYAVPGRSKSLAHVIRPEHIVTRGPVNMVDLDPVRPLAAVLEDEAMPLARFDWRSADEAVIQARLEPDHLIWVQISYDRGWKAMVNGEERPIRRDGLGFQVIDPRCLGACEILLVWDGGVQRRIAWWASVSTLAFLGIWILYWLFRRGSATTPRRQR